MKLLGTSITAPFIHRVEALLLAGRSNRRFQVETMFRLKEEYQDILLGNYPVTGR